MLVGFHGYAENAEIEFQRLKEIEGAEHWTLLSIQALHRFYRGRSSGVVASWMTSQDRELAIADNHVYTSKVIEVESREWSSPGKVVTTGFSQGVAMAFRCAVATGERSAGVIALAADIPPELDAVSLGGIPGVLLGRGTTDDWYTAERMAQDEARLRQAGVSVECLTFEGGHEWTPAFSEAAARFLKSRR